MLDDRENSELERLAFQHEVWADETRRLFNKANLKGAERILEPGCGPGYCIREFANEGIKEIWGVDSSELFINHLKKWVKNQQIENRIKPLCSDLLQVQLPENYFDACYCRWLLMFVPDVEKAVQKVYASLAPGGVFAIMEYGPFLNISISPPSKTFDKIYEGVFQLISNWGGNPDIGLQLPEILEKTGFKNVQASSISKSANPGSQLWKWIEMTGSNHKNLVENGIIDLEDLQAYENLMNTRSKNRDSVFTAPTVQHITAYK